MANTLGNIFHFLGTNMPGNFQHISNTKTAIAAPIVMFGLTYLADSFRSNTEGENTILDTILYSVGEVVAIGLTGAAFVRSGEYFFPYEHVE